MFIHGPLEDRVTRCVEEYHISTQNMIERVREIDPGAGPITTTTIQDIIGERCAGTI